MPVCMGGGVRGFKTMLHQIVLNASFLKEKLVPYSTILFCKLVSLLMTPEIQVFSPSVHTLVKANRSFWIFSGLKSGESLIPFSSWHLYSSHYKLGVNSMIKNIFRFFSPDTTWSKLSSFTWIIFTAPKRFLFT